MGKDLPPKVEKRTLVSQAYSYLRDRIVTLSLKPGEKIDVRGLSQELSISPTPIREALQKLVEQGLVVAKPYVGYFVVELTPEDIRELFDLRKALECLALKYLLQQLDEKRLDEFSHKIVAIEEEMSKRDLSKERVIEKIREFDTSFHLDFIIKGANNKWLNRLANGILDLIRLTTYLTINPRAAQEEHKAILEALYERDLPKAIARLEKHLERSLEEALGSMGGDSREKSSPW